MSAAGESVCPCSTHELWCGVLPGPAGCLVVTQKIQSWPPLHHLGEANTQLLPSRKGHKHVTQKIRTQPPLHHLADTNTQQLRSREGHTSSRFVRPAQTDPALSSPTLAATPSTPPRTQDPLPSTNAKVCFEWRDDHWLRLPQQHRLRGSMDVHSGEPGSQRRETPLVEAPGSGVARMGSEPPRAAKAVQVTPVKEEKGHSRPQLAPGSRATKGPGGSCTSALQGGEPAGRRAKNPYTKKSRSTYGVDSEGNAISFDKKVRMERNKKRAVQTQRVRSNVLFSKGVREYKERYRSMVKPTSVGAEFPTSAIVLPVATKEEEEEMVRITLEVERQEEESRCKRAAKAASAKDNRHRESHCSEDPCDHRPASGNETGVMVSDRHGLGSLRVLRAATTRVLSPHKDGISQKGCVRV